MCKKIFFHTFIVQSVPKQADKSVMLFAVIVHIIRQSTLVVGLDIQLGNPENAIFWLCINTYLAAYFGRPCIKHHTYIALGPLTLYIYSKKFQTHSVSMSNENSRLIKGGDYSILILILWKMLTNHPSKLLDVLYYLYVSYFRSNITERLNHLFTNYWICLMLENLTKDYQDQENWLRFKILEI